METITLHFEVGSSITLRGAYIVDQPLLKYLFARGITGVDYSKSWKPKDIRDWRKWKDTVIHNEVSHART